MSDTFGHLKAAPASRDAIEREVARDGMATVYLAEDLRHRRNVAINVGAEVRADLRYDPDRASVTQLRHTKIRSRSWAPLPDRR